MQDNEFPITTGSIQYMKCYSCQSMRVLACGPLDRKKKCVPSNRPMLSSVWHLSKGHHPVLEDVLFSDVC